MWYLQFHFECDKLLLSVILTIPPVCFSFGWRTFSIISQEEYLYLKFFNSTASGGGLFLLKATTKKPSSLWEGFLSKMRKKSVLTYL